MKEIIQKTAREVVSLLRRREVSPLELVEASAERIGEVEARVNALPTLCLDRARAQARQHMTRPLQNPPPWYLHGLPIVIKDLTDVKGVRTTYGSLAFKDFIPDRSDILVEILEANGAIVIGKSNTPEFGAGANTFNEVFGATLNPWNLKLTCGGSSGGSAVALATGEVWLAAGSDLAGSLRTPAAFCSVVGLRPSPGRVPCGPQKTLFGSLGVQGPMARNVADVALLLDAQCGYHPADPMSLSRPERSFIEATLHPVMPKRIAFSPDLGITPVDAEVKTAVLAAAKTWEKLGVKVDEACPDFRQAEAIFQILRAQMFLNFAPLLKEYREQIKPEIVWNIEKGLRLTVEEVLRVR